MIAGYYVTDEAYKVEEANGIRTELRFIKESDKKMDFNYIGSETRRINIATGDTEEVRYSYFSKDIELPF